MVGILWHFFSTVNSAQSSPNLFLLPIIDDLALDIMLEILFFEFFRKIQLIKPCNSAPESLPEGSVGTVVGSLGHDITNLINHFTNYFYRYYLIRKPTNLNIFVSAAHFQFSITHRGLSNIYLGLPLLVKVVGVGNFVIISFRVLDNHPLY